MKLWERLKQTFSQISVQTLKFKCIILTLLILSGRAMMVGSGMITGVQQNNLLYVKFQVIILSSGDVERC